MQSRRQDVERQKLTNATNGNDEIYVRMQSFASWQINAHVYVHLSERMPIDTLCCYEFKSHIEFRLMHITLLNVDIKPYSHLRMDTMNERTQIFKNKFSSSKN